MAEYVNEDKPMIIINETDSDFHVGVGVIFKKSGIYEISVNDRTTTVTKVSWRKKGKWIKHIDDLFPAESTIECSMCHHEQPLTIDDSFCPNCGVRMENEK